MCGRFVASRPVEEIARLLDVDEVAVAEEYLRPRWNVAPQALVRCLTVRPEDPARRRLSVFRWGLVPSWARDPSIGSRAFNARSETLTERPMFRSAVARRRCVVPADAFYEWARPAERPPEPLGDPGSAAVRRGRAPRKVPYCFKDPDGGLLLLAGLYEQWRPPKVRADDDGPELHSATAGFMGEPGEGRLDTFTILTTAANEVVGAVHDRMPVLISPGDLAVWLAPGPLEPGELAVLTRPAPNSALEGYRVSAAVNNARADGPQLVVPTEHP